MRNRDFWIYQDREISEPWAVHVWVIPDASEGYVLNARVYAEYIPFGSKSFLALSGNWETIRDTVQDVVSEYAPDGIDFTEDDTEHIQAIFETIMKG